MNSILLALFPSIIVFGPLIYLVFKYKNSIKNFCAISDLNNHKFSKNYFRILLLLFASFQTIYIASILKINQFNILFIVPILLVMISLPFSSHSYKHIVPAMIGFLISIFVMLFLSIKVTNFLAISIILIQIILGVSMIPKLINKEKIPYWILEFIILGLNGAWNIVIAIT